jgi:hypothetical protein
MRFIMGIATAGAQFLLASRAIGADFTETATLGRQTFFPTESGLKLIAEAFGLPRGAPDIIATCGQDGDKFIELLGAKTVTSFDASDYESS